MNLQQASREVAYGWRGRVLFAAILFPLPLLHALIGNIRLTGLTLYNALTLAAAAGMYVSLLLFLTSPVKRWWAFRVTLAITAAGCTAWILRAMIALSQGQLLGSPVTALVILIIGSLCVFGCFRPRPDVGRDQQLISAPTSVQPAAWWVSGLVWLALLVVVLAALRLLYGMFS